MWKEITDAQRDGREWLVVGWDKWPQATLAVLHFVEDLGWISQDDLDRYALPTHYWDFGLDTPLPPPPKGDE